MTVAPTIPTTLSAGVMPYPYAGIPSTITTTVDPTILTTSSAGIMPYPYTDMPGTSMPDTYSGQSTPYLYSGMPASTVYHMPYQYYQVLSAAVYTRA